MGFWRLVTHEIWNDTHAEICDQPGKLCFYMLHIIFIFIFTIIFTAYIHIFMCLFKCMYMYLGPVWSLFWMKVSLFLSIKTAMSKYGSLFKTQTLRFLVIFRISMDVSCFAKFYPAGTTPQPDPHRNTLKVLFQPLLWVSICQWSLQWW